MAEGRLPVGAEAPQIGRHHRGGQVRDRPRPGQHQQAGVVGNQPQPRELLLRAPADPAVARTALEGARLPTDQGQPTLLVFGHIAQTATGKLLEPQIVTLGHGGIPAAALIGARQPQGHVLDRGGRMKSDFSMPEQYQTQHEKASPPGKLPVFSVRWPWNTRFSSSLRDGCLAAGGASQRRVRFRLQRACFRGNGVPRGCKHSP